MTDDQSTSFLNGEVPVTGQHSPNSHAPEVHEFTAQPTAIDGADENGLIQADVLVIGAGFSGMTAIHRMRRAGFTVKCFDTASYYGGSWYWNRYPGARVDSECPFYQLNIPEVYNTWNYSQRFPDHEEIRRYMAHADKTLNLRKDTYFNARVNSASWNETTGKWTIKTQQGHVAIGKYLVLASGALNRTYTPNFPGLESYKGRIFHSGAWNEEFSAKGKRVGIIGAGASAVQITQELGKVADQLTVFVRTPSFCVPMRQRDLTLAEQNQLKPFYPALFKAGRNSFTGVPASITAKGFYDLTAEEREAHWNETWDQGGFNFSLRGFRETISDKHANEETYQYWRKRVAERLTDPEKLKIMAPASKPYYFNTKRNPLEQDYYDVLNQSNVHIHSLEAAPLDSFTETGMRMADGNEYELDAVILATGFDSFTGSVTNMGLTNREGVDLRDVWASGVSTYLGLTIPGFPNLFMAYAPHAPTVIANATSLIEVQIEAVVAMIRKLEHEHMRSIEPTSAAAAEWKATLDAMAARTLRQFTASWWNCGNIPGKPVENMVYGAGLDKYEAHCLATLDRWEGFTIVKDDGADIPRNPAVL